MSPHDVNGDTAAWVDGWYALADQCPSPNFGPRPNGAQVDLIVLHSISLPPGQYGGHHVQDLFANQLDWDQHPYFQSIRGIKVSSHFFIFRTSELLQFVSCNDRAWHAGASRYRGRDNCNDDSIGIELEGLEGEHFETAQYEALAELCLVLIRLEGLEGLLFEDAQYETLTSLCAAILLHYPIKHIAGHEHIAPGRKIDPGKGFDWSRLQRSLACMEQILPAGSLLKNTD